MSPFLLTEARVQEALKQVYDPELGVNVVDLGLIYGIAIQDKQVRVTMTLTTAGCPLHDSLSEAVQSAIKYTVPEVDSVIVDMVWEPAWSPDRMTEAGKRELGWG